jgi:hypothetical protein
MSDELNFDSLEPIEVSVSIRGKKYVLCEATSEAAIRYRDGMMRSTKLNADGKPASIDGLCATEPTLVKDCLYELLDPKDFTKRKPVTIEFVRGLLYQVQKKLYEKVKEISPGLSDNTKESLTKERENIDKKLAILQATEDSSKNMHSAMADSSV